jgi:hypothetical protein
MEPSLKLIAQQLECLRRDVAALRLTIPTTLEALAEAREAYRSSAPSAELGHPEEAPPPW